jgi:hypothetical protein
MAGLKVVSVKVHEDGNLDLLDLKAKAEKHKDKLAAFMVRVLFIFSLCLLTRSQITYPSTFGVFEDGVQDVNLFPRSFAFAELIGSLCRPAKSYTKTVVKYIWMAPI